MDALYDLSKVAGGIALVTSLPVGCSLAVARVAVGSAPQLAQDFGLVIGGALVFEIVSAVGILLASAKPKPGDNAGDAATGFMLLFGVPFAAGVGAVAGAVTSVTWSIFS